MMKRYGLVALSLVLILSFSVTATELKRAKVVDVINGHTIGVELPDGSSDLVRYIGIDDAKTSDKALGYNETLVEDKVIWLEMGDKVRTSDGLMLAYAAHRTAL